MSDLRHKTVHGLVWQFVGVGGQRVVQLIAPMVIARTIDAIDIGLFVVLLTGIGIVESLTLFMGEQSTISSDRGSDRRYLDTVFTVRVLRSVVISAALCALAPGFAWFFADPATADRYWLTGLFLVLAGNGLIDGLQSPARAARLKGMEFRRIVFCDFLAALIGMGVTVALALRLHDIWALLIGYLAGTAARTTLSYLAAPHRPRIVFDREALRELLHYSKGAAGAPFLLFSIFAAPALVLGKLLHDKSGLAVFEYAGRLAKLPEDIFLRVLAPVAIPAYAQLRNDRPRLTRAWLGAVNAFLLVGAPLTVSLAWCGSALPSIAFGPQYGTIDGLFVLQCVHGGLTGLTAVIGPLFWAIGQPQWDRNAQLYRCLAIYGLGIPTALYAGVLGFAAATCIAIGVALALSIAQAMRFLNLRAADLWHSMQGGLLLGGSLLGTLLVLDLTVAPSGWWRVLAAAGIGGPVIGGVLLRLLRHRRTPAATAADPAS